MGLTEAEQALGLFLKRANGDRTHSGIANALAGLESSLSLCRELLLQLRNHGLDGSDLIAGSVLNKLSSVLVILYRWLDSSEASTPSLPSSSTPGATAVLAFVAAVNQDAALMETGVLPPWQPMATVLSFVKGAEATLGSRVVNDPNWLSRVSSLPVGLSLEAVFDAATVMVGACPDLALGPQTEWQVNDSMDDNPSSQQEVARSLMFRAMDVCVTLVTSAGISHMGEAEQLQGASSSSSSSSPPPLSPSSSFQTASAVVESAVRLLGTIASASPSARAHVSSKPQASELYRVLLQMLSSSRPRVVVAALHALHALVGGSTIGAKLFSRSNIAEAVKCAVQVIAQRSHVSSSATGGPSSSKTHAQDGSAHEPAQGFTGLNELTSPGSIGGSMTLRSLLDVDASRSALDLMSALDDKGLLSPALKGTDGAPLALWAMGKVAGSVDRLGKADHPWASVLAHFGWTMVHRLQSVSFEAQARFVGYMSPMSGPHDIPTDAWIRACSSSDPLVRSTVIELIGTVFAALTRVPEPGLTGLNDSTIDSLSGDELEAPVGGRGPVAAQLFGEASTDRSFHASLRAITSSAQDSSSAVFGIISAWCSMLGEGTVAEGGAAFLRGGESSGGVDRSGGPDSVHFVPGTPLHSRHGARSVSSSFRSSSPGRVIPGSRGGRSAASGGAGEAGFASRSEFVVLEEEASDLGRIADFLHGLASHGPVTLRALISGQILVDPVLLTIDAWMAVGLVRPALSLVRLLLEYQSEGAVELNQGLQRLFQAPSGVCIPALLDAVEADQDNELAEACWRVLRATSGGQMDSLGMLLTARLAAKSSRPLSTPVSGSRAEKRVEESRPKSPSGIESLGLDDSSGLNDLGSPVPSQSVVMPAITDTSVAVDHLQGLLDARAAALSQADRLLEQSRARRAAVQAANEDLVAANRALASRIEVLKGQLASAEQEVSGLRAELELAKEGMTATQAGAEEAVESAKQALTRAEEEHKMEMGHLIERLEKEREAAVEEEKEKARKRAAIMIRTAEEAAEKAVEEARREAEERVERVVVEQEAALDAVREEGRSGVKVLELELETLRKRADEEAREAQEVADKGAEAKIKDALEECERRIAEADVRAREEIASVKGACEEVEALAQRRVKAAEQRAADVIAKVRGDAREAVSKVEASARAAVTEAESRARIAEGMGESTKAICEERVAAALRASKAADESSQAASAAATARVEAMEKKLVEATSRAKELEENLQSLSEDLVLERHRGEDRVRAEREVREEALKVAQAEAAEELSRVENIHREALERAERELRGKEGAIAKLQEQVLNAEERAQVAEQGEAKSRAAVQDLSQRLSEQDAELTRLTHITTYIHSLSGGASGSGSVRGEGPSVELN